MDMEHAFDVSGLAANPHADGPATSGLDYLRHVMNERDLVPDVVAAHNVASSPNTLRISEFKKVAADKPGRVELPSRQWHDYQIASFSNLRQQLVRIRANLSRQSALPSYNFPGPDDAMAWKSLCLRKWTDQVPKESFDPETVDKLSKSHKGTPPFLKLVLAIPIGLIPSVLCFHIDWIIEEQARISGKSDPEIILPGNIPDNADYVPSDEENEGDQDDSEQNNAGWNKVENSGEQNVDEKADPESNTVSESGTNPGLESAEKPESESGDCSLVADPENFPTAHAHWLFALLSVLEKPVFSDTTAALRDLARFCVERRNEITSDDDPAIWIYSWFIGVIALYFDQKDFVDYL